MVLKESDLEVDGTIKVKESYKQFWLAVLATVIGVVITIILTAGLEVWKSKNLQPPPPTIVVRPKGQVFHDTIWLTDRIKKTPLKK